MINKLFVISIYLLASLLCVDMYSQNWINKPGATYTAVDVDLTDTRVAASTVRMHGISPKTGYPKQDGQITWEGAPNTRIEGVVDYALAFVDVSSGTQLKAGVKLYYDADYTYTGAPLPSTTYNDTIDYSNIPKGGLTNWDFTQNIQEDLYFTDLMFSNTRKLVGNTNVKGRYRFNYNSGTGAAYDFTGYPSYYYVRYKDNTTFTYDGAGIDVLDTQTVNRAQNGYNPGTTGAYTATPFYCDSIPTTNGNYGFYTVDEPPTAYYNLVLNNGGGNGSGIAAKRVISTVQVKNQLIVDKNAYALGKETDYTGSITLLDKDVNALGSNAVSYVDGSIKLNDRLTAFTVMPGNMVNIGERDKNGSITMFEDGRVSNGTVSYNTPINGVTTYFSATPTKRLDVKKGTILNVYGELINNNGLKAKTGDAMVVDSQSVSCASFERTDGTAPPCKVIYYGAGSVLPMNVFTSNTTNLMDGRYGYPVLEFAQGSKRYLVGDVYISGEYDDIKVFDTNYTSLRYKSDSNLSTNGYKIMLYNKTANIKFDTRIGEIDGWVQYGATYNSSSFVLLKNKEYTYNNYETKLKFDSSQTGNNLNLYFAALNVHPKIKPSKAKYTPSIAHLIADREIEFTYLTNTNYIRLKELSLGFKKNEFGTDQTLAEFVYNRSKLTEGFKLNADYSSDRPQSVINTDGTRNISKPVWTAISEMEVFPVKFETTGQGLILLNPNPGQSGAIANAPGTFDQIFSKSQLIFDATPSKLFSVRNGRWSDPQTWDAAITPTASDSVEIRHIVYTGLYNGNELFGGRAWKVAEDKLVTGTNPAAEANVLALNVEIVDNPFDPITQNSALVIGNYSRNDGDNYMDFRKILAFGKDCDYAVDIKTTPLPAGTMPEDFLIEDAMSPYIYRRLSGLYIMDYTNDNKEAPIVKVSNLLNKGNFRNNAIFEIGEIKY